MIVVALNKSYPVVVDDVKNGLHKSHLSMGLELREITLGDWPKLSESSLEGYTDYVVGVYDDAIVTAYKISGHEIVEYNGVDKIRFSAESIYVRPETDTNSLFDTSTFKTRIEDKAAWLIGCPIPGGPWRKGESRGTRRYRLKDYLNDYPQLVERQTEEYSHRRAEFLCKFYAGIAEIEGMDFPQFELSSNAPKTGSDEGITVVRQPGGTVVITVPTGVKAQINIDPTL